jgi:hypothetical protein
LPGAIIIGAIKSMRDGFGSCGIDAGLAIKQASCSPRV